MVDQMKQKIDIINIVRISMNLVKTLNEFYLGKNKYDV